MRKILKKLNGESGQSAALFALVLVALMGFSALVVDVGRIYLARTQLQNAADIAALAAAYDLPTAGTAINTGKHYAAMNGADEAGTTVTTPYNGDPNKVEVVCSKYVSYTFARILGFAGRDVSGRAVAASSGSVGAFGYAVFSGDPHFQLAIYGGSTTIGGGVHSNDSIIMTGNNENIAGCMEAVSKIEIYGGSENIGGALQAGQLITYGENQHFGSRNQSASPFVEMPDFSDLVRQEAENAGQVYHGSKTFNGCNIDVNKPIYIDGDLTINGDTFSGSGVVLVKGDITFNGSNVSSSGNAICFYSETGSIYIHGDGAKLDGMLYAPNGSITLNGSRQTINGRVIGNKVFFSGDSYSISGGGGDIIGVPKGGVKLVE